MAVKAFKAALAGAAIRRVVLRNEGQFELVLDSHEFPPGNRPPKMTYLLQDQQAIQLCQLMQAVLRSEGLEVPTPPNGDAPTSH